MYKETFNYYGMVFGMDQASGKVLVDYYLGFSTKSCCNSYIISLQGIALIFVQYNYHTLNDGMNL